MNMLRGRSSRKRLIFWKASPNDVAGNRETNCNERTDMKPKRAGNCDIGSAAPAQHNKNHHLQQHPDPQRQRCKGGQPDHQLAVRRAGARLKLRGNMDADEDGKGQAKWPVRSAAGQAIRNSGTASQLETYCVR
jgi:hypothetical protein